MVLILCYGLTFTLFQKRDYIFDVELKLSIYNNFGTLITKSIGHQQVFLFSHIAYFTYLEELLRPQYQMSRPKYKN